MSTTARPPTRSFPPRRAALALLLVAATALAWIGSLDTLSRQYVDAGLKRAMVTFAAARSANAIISVLQSSTVSFSVGAGVSASPGQALQPLNEVVEDFSNLMLAACVSLGAQRLLMSIGALQAVSAALTLGLFAWLWFALRGRDSPPWLARALLLLLFFRFAVPLAALGSEAAFRVAMSTQYDQAQSQVDLALAPPAVPGADAANPPGSIERFRHWLDEAGSGIKQQLAQLKDRMENGIQHIVTLMAIFVVQTAVLPLLFAWLAWRVFALLLRRPPPAQMPAYHS